LKDLLLDLLLFLTKIYQLGASLQIAINQLQVTFLEVPSCNKSCSIFFKYATKEKKGNIGDCDLPMQRFFSMRKTKAWE
jgi:hypothetical protein